MEAVFFFPFRPTIGQTFPTSICNACANAGRNVLLTVVGYSTINITNKYNIIGINFDAVGAQEKDINEIFPYVEGMTQGGTEAAADQIQVRVGNSYEIYYISNGKVGKNTKPELVGKWVLNTKSSVVSDRKFKSGDGFWYISAKSNEQLKETPYSITVSGQVLMNAEKQSELGGLYSIISSPYPVDVPINGGIVVENGTQGGTESAADQIQIRNGDSYAIYYLSNGKVGKNTKPELVGKWVLNTKSSVATDDKLSAGKGFWFIRKSDETTVKIVNPISM